MAHAPKASMRADVSQDLKRVFDADDEPEATRRLKQMIDRYQNSAPALATWLDENLPEALTVLSCPPPYHRCLRTTNDLERLNEEFKLRTRVATLFQNEASLPGLVSAVLSEISDDCETQRTYLTMETR
jgi:putative transposase